ncbi:type II secretion system F family protein [Sphingomonas sp. KR1UV-12]|uniref:Type II secretion system F family protein n=1 Tax=Sphingomonas aurea TaxID=3063994 RepID=A0ABT9EFQ5_9SPHN|nr:type II secretion system F family protein [Sphingomonas sp. KR1UV-12]MDP1025791.1 type II secretion system F family protein [Sphingomonas sp. KR1UV-12]
MFFPVLLMAISAAMLVVVAAIALSGPSASRSQARRIAGLRDRHAHVEVAESQSRGIAHARDTRMDLAFGRILPNRELLAKRLAMTGRDWTVGQYGQATAGLVLAFTLLLWLKGLPIFIVLLLGVTLGCGLPHFVVSRLIARRVGKFTVRFPDAIDLLVRGLRSGLPISETMGVVGHEVEGPVGEEFRSISDKMKIGRTMDVALQETADRLGTAEFQFFVITIAIQRETGGNLAETLSNLADVLRKRGQMKLKIRAMSSESKASAYIIGSLPFIVFGLIWFINDKYMQNFFVDERLIATGMGGMVWMGIGGFIMAKMISFEI